METNKNKKRSIAVLLHKEPLEEGACLYTFVNTIIGYYDEVTQVLTDDQGREYDSLDSELAILGNTQFACGNIMSLDAAIDKYLDGKQPENIQELLNVYDEEESNYFYLCGIDDNGLLVLLKHHYPEELTAYYEKILGEDGEIDPNLTIEEIQEKANAFKEELQLANDLNMSEIEKNLKENKYSKEELMNLKNKLTTKNININQLIEMTDKQLFGQTKKTNKKEEDKYYYSDGVLNINALLKEIKKTLIAQDEPAKKLLVQICKKDLVKSKNYGILISGSTGVGKTELMTLISEKLGRPFLIVDTMQITSPGYEGKNIEQCLYELYEKCGKNIEKAEKAIIYFDEIDKKGSSKKDDVAGQGVLNLLLKFLDGTTYQAAPNLQSRGLMNAVNIKTNDMLIIAGGAFSDLYRNEKAQIGFGQSTEQTKNNEPSVKDFVEKAMMTEEFMGRFPVRIRLNDLKKDDMKRILLESNKSPVKTEKEIFKKLNCKLDFTDEAYEEFAKTAEKLKEGARGLNGVVTDSTSKAFEDINTERDKYASITITKETISDNTKYQYVLRKDKQKKKAL